MARPRLHDDQLRERLLDAATHLVAAEGDTFALRPLAESLGTSTTAIYSLFGSRGALMDAVAQRSGDSFVQALEGVGDDDPLVVLYALGLAHRCWVQHNPSTFRVVVQRAAIAPESRAVLDRAFIPVRRAVEKAIDQGDLHGEPGPLVDAFTACVYGWVSLETFITPTSDEAYSQFLTGLLQGYLTPAGRERLDDPDDLSQAVEQVMSRVEVPELGV